MDEFPNPTPTKIESSHVLSTSIATLIGVDMGVFLLGFKPSLVVSEGFGLEIVPFGDKEQAKGGGEVVAGCGGVAEEMEVLGVVVGVVA